MSGVHVPQVLREIIYNFRVLHGLEPEDIYEDIIADLSPPPMTLKRLKELCRMFDDEDRVEESLAYKNGDRSRSGSAGRPPKLTDEAKGYLRGLVDANRTARLHALKNSMALEYYENLLDAPSVTTIHVELLRMDLPRKKITRYHRDADPEAQFQHYLDIGHIHPVRLCDIDGMTQNPKAFFDTHGRAPRGEECIRQQVVLNNVSYGIFGAYEYNGFSTWRIYEGSCSSEHVIDFLKCVTEVVHDECHLLLDNASNQRSAAATKTLEQLYAGRYHYVPPYSPRLKPIERGFANVKRYIRAREYTHKGETDPIGLINEAFHYYSFMGEGSFTGKHHLTLTLLLTITCSLNTNSSLYFLLMHSQRTLGYL